MTTLISQINIDQVMGVSMPFLRILRSRHFYIRVRQMRKPCT